jgi:hypothetical protein
MPLRGRGAPAVNICLAQKGLPFGGHTGAASASRRSCPFYERATLCARAKMSLGEATKVLGYSPLLTKGRSNATDIRRTFSVLNLGPQEPEICPRTTGWETLV